MRNFIYNKSDIIVAVLIIVVALIIIFFRVNAIMNFGDSKTVAADPTNATSSPSAIEDSDSADADTTENVDPPADGDNNNDTTSTEDVSLKIESGSSTGSIANDLVDKGLVASADEFKKEVSAQKAETKLKAGTFNIPAGSSVADIVKILSK